MRNPYFFYGVFAVIGVPCFLLALYFSATNIQKSITWETAEGVINGYDETNYPLITFDYQGKAHEFGSFYKNDDLHDGDTVTVYFPPNEPDKAEVGTFFAVWFLPMFLSIFGVVFGGVGVIGIIAQRNKLKDKDELFTQQRGKKLAGLTAVVSLNKRLKVNGRSPFIVSATWADPVTQTNYDFVSENLWTDPTPLITNNKVDVYIDESNPKRYYVDISFIK